jgi:hypothetical protein
MDDQSRDVRPAKEQPVTGTRAEWQRPEWRRLDTHEAEAAAGNGADLIFS